MAELVCAAHHCKSSKQERLWYELALWQLLVVAHMQSMPLHVVLTNQPTPSEPCRLARFSRACWAGLPLFIV